jgi:predicted phosphodiesterase
MNIQVMSDLHFETHRDGGEEFIRDLDPAGVDVLVLAGDITSARFYETLDHAFGRLTKKYRNIIYVAGNHEYYKSSPRQVRHSLDRLAKNYPGVLTPENEVVTINGQRFVCGTMWFPRPDPIGESAKKFMNDFHMIRNFEPWVYDQNAAFERLLAVRLEEGDVVVTHHLPSFGSVAPQFASSALNAFFVSAMDDYFVQKPQLWIHGHTHVRCDYNIGKTRVVCMPHGYPNEIQSLTAFDSNFKVEI